VGIVGRTLVSASENMEWHGNAISCVSMPYATCMVMHKMTNRQPNIKYRHFSKFLVLVHAEV